MIDIPSLLDRLTQWMEFVRRYWSLGSPPDPRWIVAFAVLGGLILALWGARLMRAAYVIGFMVAGATLGIKVAKQHEWELLIGLVLGAGVAGLAGHILYRWWIGLTAGMISAAIVLSLTAPWTLRQAEAFADTLLMQATGQRLFALVAPVVPGEPSATAPEPLTPDGPLIDWVAVAAGLRPGEDQPMPAPSALIAAWGKAVWAALPGEFRNSMLMAVLIGLLGLAIGGLLPRFTTIVATSVVGVMAIATAAVYLISAKAPETWSSIQAKPAWLNGTIGLALLVSLAFQVRRGKLRQIVPAAAANSPSK
jgi:hypothetical protein